MKQTSSLVRGLLALSTLCLIVAVAPMARAIPILQVYVEGGTYDTETESWEISGNTATVSVVVNTTGPGGIGAIEDVHLVVAYDASAGGFVTLASADGSPAPSGGAPVTGGIPPHLEPHSIYGDDTTWVDYSLGSFTDSDDPLTDYNEDYPSGEWVDGASDTQVYTLTITGISGAHLDVYSNDKDLKGRDNAPYSHDADVHGVKPVPELSVSGAGSAAILLLGVGLILAGPRRRRDLPS